MSTVKVKSGAIKIAVGESESADRHVFGQVLRQKDLRLKEAVGGGWTASLVQSVLSPVDISVLPSIVLVTLSKDKQTRRVRLDLGKGMFLDATPKGIGLEDGGKLAESVANRLVQAGRVGGS